KPGDKIFTIKFVLNEKQSVQLPLLVAAAFRGKDVVKSIRVGVSVWNATSTGMGLVVNYPAGWKLRPLQPQSDPSGINGVEIIDPEREEYSSEGIAISTERM